MVDNIPVEWFNLFIICIFDLKKCRLGSVTSICCNFYFCALQDDWLCFWCGRSYGRLEKAKSIESNLLTTTTTTAKKTWKKKSWCMWERRRKARVCVCVCTVRTTGHKFQHSRPLLVRPDTDAINPRVRSPLFFFPLFSERIPYFLLLQHTRRRTERRDERPVFSSGCRQVRL